MKTILELDITPKERDVLFDVLQMMNISFKSRDTTEAETASFEAGGTYEAIQKAVENTLGMWENHASFKSFDDFRKQAWGGVLPFNGGFANPPLKGSRRVAGAISNPEQL